MMLCRILMTVSLLGSSIALASSTDGFNAASKFQTKHFTIYFEKDVDADLLIKQLSITDTDLLLTNQSIDSSSSVTQLASKMDVLFNRTCDILDMHVNSFKGDIKVFKSQEELKKFYQQLYHQDLPCTGYSFYLNDYNAIYIAAENFRRDILGHEIGHAVISSYFVVSPSMKIQEVLAGYVEYQLKKSKSAP